MENKYNKLVKFWLQRTLSEKTTEIKKLSEDISVLNYQQNNFDSMRDEIKDEVLEDLMKHLRVYKWNDAQIELVKSYDLLRQEE